MFKINSIYNFIKESRVVSSKIQDVLRDRYVSELEKLFIFQTNDDSIELNMIRIKPNYKNQGIGKKIMQDLVDWSDANNLIIHLTPGDDWGSDIKRLKKFYKSFGFVNNKGKNKDYRFRDSMIRYPR